MKEINMDERLDMFYMSHLSRHVNLKEVVKLVMISSHGNAGVESGFSTNEEMLVENMSEDSLEALKMVFNGVINKGGISNVDINRKMLKLVNKAHLEYVKQLEKRKGQQTSGVKKKEPRNKKDQLKNVKETKQKFTEQQKQKTGKIESQKFNLLRKLNKLSNFLNN